MADDLQTSKNRVHRKIVMESIIRQALTMPDWQECCADLMSAHGLRNSDVIEALKRRASIIALLQPILCMATWSLALCSCLSFKQALHETFGEPYLSFVAAFIAIACMVGIVCTPVYCLPYCPILVWLHRQQIYISQTQALLLGCFALPLSYWLVVLGIFTASNAAPSLLNQVGGWLFAVTFLLLFGSPLFMAWLMSSISKPLIPSNSERVHKHKH